MVDRRSGGGPEDWSEEEWPGGEWERGERPSRPAAPRGADRPRAPRAAGDEIDADLSRVMDDPMFDALPGGVPLPERGRPGLRRPDRLSARRERSGLSAGQTVLLLFAIALVAGVSFAAGLLLGASGDRTLLSWIPGFGGPATETVTADRPLDAGVAADAPAEGVITFGEHGRVPPKLEEGAEPLPEEKARAAAKPEDRGDTEAPPERKPEVPGAARADSPEVPGAARAGSEDAAAPAQPESNREAAPPPAPAPEKAAGDEAQGAREAGPSEDMTFYDTATGKREVPGLNAEATGGGDSEAPAEAAPEPADEATAEAPLGADVLARRRAGQAEPPPPSPVVSPEESPAAGAAEEPPSGAEILARRRAETADGMAGAPAPIETPRAETPAAETPGAESPAAGTYTVQVATLTTSEEARGLAERLAAKGFRARIDTLDGSGGRVLYRVRVGRYSDERSAQRDLDRIREEPGTSPFIKME